MHNEREFENKVKRLFIDMRGGENRIHIINLLRNGPLNANQITTALQVNHRTVLHHIEVLCQAELIKGTPNNYDREYSLTAEMENNIFYFDTLIKQKPPGPVDLPIDDRRLLSVIADIKLTWKNGKKEEYMAMEHGIIEFHKWLCAQQPKR